MLKIIFMGTSDFAVPSLQALMKVQDFRIQEVVTQEDRPRDRGHQLKPSPVKQCALELGLPIFQPLKVRAEESQARITAIPAEIIVVASYGQILPGWLLDYPRYGAVNVHGSLLPRHRGASPVQSAILSGDDCSGITIIKMDPGMDTGPILLQESTWIHPEETGGALHDRLALMGANLLVEALFGILDGSIRPVPQNDLLATKAGKIHKSDGWLDWSKPAMELHRRVRAFNPWPSCMTLFRNQELRIWKTGLFEDESGLPLHRDSGRLLVHRKQHLLAACGDGKYLEIVEASLPGRKRVSGTDLIHGHRIQSGESLATPSLRE